ncbi:MAG TPA: hypothetical protein VGM56_01900 [Byssovorax sp.]
MRRVASAGACVMAAALSTAEAHADDTTAARRAAAAREMGQPYAMAALGAGFIGLPAAEVCPTSLTQCSHGEASLALGIHFLYRWREFGVGGGIEWATTLRSDAARGDSSLGRDHSRRYFLIEGQFRYYPLRRSAWEWWTGATFGAVIVNDSWSEYADRDPPTDADIQGPRAATLGTEGLAAGIGTGVEWSFLRNVSLGADLRYANWFLPNNRSVLPTGDVASLSGRVDMFELGVVLAYRIAL